MQYFRIIEDAHAILVRKGVSLQVPVYRRGQALYAKYGAGFIRLFEKGTSIPDVRLDDIDVPDAILSRDSFGRLEWVTND